MRDLVIQILAVPGVHSHQEHIVALCEILNRNGIKVDVHAFLDGRDTPPTSAEGFLADFNNSIKEKFLANCTFIHSVL